MAQHYNPHIVTDGLVLSLDKYDEISYPGEPTTNLISDGRWESAAAWSSPGWGGWGNSSMISLVTADLPNDPSRGVYGGTGPVVQFGPSGWGSGVSGMQINLNYTDQTAGTVSFWYRTLNTGSGNMWSGFYQYPGLDSRDAYISVGSTTDWAFYSTTRTWTNSSGHAYRFITDSNSHDGTDFTWQLWGIQFEKKSHVTKFVNGSRSATDGWKDLSGNGNHADLTSLTYSTTNIKNTPNNDFSFGGSSASDYITCGNSIDMTSHDTTLQAWIYIETLSHTDSTHSVFGGAATSGHGYHEIRDSGSSVYKMTFWTSTDGWQYANTGLSAQTWYHVTWVWDGLELTWYLNGVNDGSYTFTTMSPYGLGFKYIGAWNSSLREFNGKIDIATVYNRALSSTEVLQNFNAKRSRFGV